MKWETHFMAMCHTVSQKSEDKSTKVGAVIVGPDHEIRSTGYNGLPRGMIGLSKFEEPLSGVAYIPIPDLRITKKVAQERIERPLKYFWTEHAERNAIYNAARVGIPLKGCTIYINSLPPCTDCARAIIQSGIIEVRIIPMEVPERWKEDCTIAKEMLLECGVGVYIYDDSKA